jgi:hypothetical protein
MNEVVFSEDVEEIVVYSSNDLYSAGVMCQAAFSQWWSGRQE